MAAPAAQPAPLPATAPVPAPPVPQAGPDQPAAYGAPAYAAPVHPGSGYAASTGWAPAPAPQNVLAWVSFGLGLGGLMLGLLASIPAIVLGHIARRQLRERGEQGDAAALTGLIAGYVISALWILGIAAYVLFFVVLFGAVTVSSGVGSAI